MIYLLTPTGGRPEGLALLGEYLNAQTYNGPAMWVVVDDVDPQSHVPACKYMTQVIRPAWRWEKGQNTQAQSLLAGLAAIPLDAVLFVIEDDDCYLPDYIETMLRGLETADLVGENTARYYNVRTRKWRQMDTKRHSSLASTAIRGTLPLVEVCKKRGKFMDTTLWRTYKGRTKLLDAQNVIGIKGLPGRAGIGVGHRHKFGTPDTGDKLREWAGDYASNYEVFSA